MKPLKAFGQFWYDFIIGDDWKIAAGVVIALLIIIGLMLATPLNDTVLTVVGGLLAIAAFTVSLAIDVRAGSFAPVAERTMAPDSRDATRY